MKYRNWAQSTKYWERPPKKSGRPWRNFRGTICWNQEWSIHAVSSQFMNRNCFLLIEPICFRTIPSSALSLIKQFLIFNPEMRITSLNALASSYFSHEPAACLPHEYASLSYSSQSRLPTPEGDWHEYETKLRRKRSAATITASSNSTHSVGSNEDISATLTSSPPSSTKKSKLTYHPNANKNYHKKPK